jgi:hypothetical protein
MLNTAELLPNMCDNHHCAGYLARPFVKNLLIRLFIPFPDT